jgi:hypothetical protein
MYIWVVKRLGTLGGVIHRVKGMRLSIVVSPSRQALKREYFAYQYLERRPFALRTRETIYLLGGLPFLHSPFPTPLWLPSHPCAGSSPTVCPTLQMFLG